MKGAARHFGRRGLSGLLYAAGFLAALGAAGMADRRLLAVSALYLVLSVVAFVVYAADKSAAVRGARRIPENTLHLLALFGGWPGALAAQRLLRHKSLKASFLAVFWLTVIVNCGALAGLAWAASAHPLPRF